MEKVFTDQNFEEEVLHASRPVLVDFYADWCMPCKMMAPIIEKLAEEYAGRVDIGKLDVDANPKMQQTYHVMSIPTLILFEKGEVKEQSVGAVSEKDLKEKLDRLL